MAADTLTNKILRTLTATLLPVADNREGTCLGCGGCCNLVYKCPFLTHTNNKAHCTIYPYRPPACRKYPRTAKEQVHQPCGYHFNGTK